MWGKKMNRPAESLKVPRAASSARTLSAARTSAAVRSRTRGAASFVHGKVRTIADERGLVICLFASLLLLDVRFKGT